MIPTIAEIFHALSRGEMAFDDAETYVRTHIRLAHRLGHRFDKIELRDTFAAHAVSAFVHPEEWQSTVGELSREVAFNAYALADAMLAERKIAR